MIIESYLELSYCATMNVTHKHSDTNGDSLSLIIAYIFSAVTLAFPLLILALIIYWLRHHNVSSTHLKLFSPFFD